MFVKSTFNGFEYNHSKINIVLYATFLFCMHNYYFVCTIIILYAQLLFCMYNYYFICTIIIFYFQILFNIHKTKIIKQKEKSSEVHAGT